jgi:ABC-type amino acid transport system permease subunit
MCLNFPTVINIKILKFTSHIAAFLSAVLITEMLEICIQTSYDKNVQLILKSYLPVVNGTPLITHLVSSYFSYYWSLQEYYNASLCVRTNTLFSFAIRSDHTVIGPYKNITKPQYVLELTPHSHL